MSAHRSAVVILAVTLLALPALAAPKKKSAPPPPPAGLVVEEVTAGSIFQKAGIEPGDVLVSWSTPDVRGDLRSIFEFSEVAAERVPHGNVSVTVKRGDATTTKALPQGFVRSWYRPVRNAEATASYEAAKKLATEKKVDEAVVAYRALLPTVEREEGPAGGVWLRLRIAAVYADNARPADASKVYDEAIARATEAQLPPAIARSAELKGAMLLRRNELAEAEKAYRQSIEIRRAQAPGSLSLAQSLHETAEVLLRRRDTKAADELYAEVLTIRERQVPGSRDVAEVHNSLGRSAFMRGDIPTAEGHWRRGLAIIEKVAPNGFEHAAGLNGLGVAAFNRYDLDTAEGYWRRALEVLTKLFGDRPETASLLNNLAAVSKDRGDLAAAEDYLRRSLAIREKLVPDSLDIAESLNNLGNLYTVRKELEAAEEVLNRSLAIRQKIAPNSLEAARTLNNLGHIALDRGRLDDAEKLYREGLELARKIGPESTETGRAYGDLASVSLARGDAAKTRELQQQAMAIFEKLAPTGLDLANSLQDLGDAAMLSREYSAADGHYRRSLELREKLSPASFLVAQSLHRLGRSARDAGRLPEAATYFERAIEAIESQAARVGGSEDTRTGFLAGHVDYYRDAIDVLLRLKKSSDAFHLLERSRAQRLLAMLAERDLVLRGVPEELERERKSADREYDKLQQQLTALAEGNDAAKIEKAASDLRAARARQQEISERIRKQSPELASLRYPQPLNVEETSRVLDPGTLLLSYSIGADSSTLFVVQAAADARGKSPLTIYPIAAGSEPLRTSVERFRSLIARGARGADNTAQVRAEAAKLTKLLVAPARKLVARADRLLVSPDGPLHLLPFSALGGVERAGYLTEEKPVHVVVSATVYAELQKRRAAKAPERVDLAAFGDPKYPSAEGGATSDAVVRSLVKRYGLEPLPATRTEVVRIAALFGDDARQFLGGDAREEKAKEVAGSARFLHFASHGVVDEAFPLNSGIVLTIPDQSGAGDNGILQAWEIFESVRMDATLVVLSACETALGKEVGGEGLVGISRAFQYAGAQSVLASLWNVADESTAVLMENLYRSMRAGTPKDEALRAAQLALLRDGRFAHPYHWAAFQLMGDWR